MNSSGYALPPPHAPKEGSICHTPPSRPAPAMTHRPLWPNPMSPNPIRLWSRPTTSFVAGSIRVGESLGSRDHHPLGSTG
jgi:hypothetical protein